MKGLSFILVFLIQVSVYAQQGRLDTTQLSEPEKSAFARVESYRQRVLKGESMSTLAALYTEDPGSAKTGGRYDGIARGQFVPEFEAAMVKLSPGGISEVFQTTYGFHFIQLIGIRGDLFDVRHILITPKTNQD